MITPVAGPDAIPEGASFLAQWRGLDARERRRIRRFVRLGRPVEPHHAALAIAYARFQRDRPWARLFWLWFVPGIVLALGTATQLHPVAVGVVIALAAQAVLARRNLRRVEAVNRP